MNYRRICYRSGLRQLIFNIPWEIAPITPDEIEEWELSFDEDLLPDEETALD